MLQCVAVDRDSRRPRRGDAKAVEGAQRPESGYPMPWPPAVARRWRRLLPPHQFSADRWRRSRRSQTTRPRTMARVINAKQIAPLGLLLVCHRGCRRSGNPKQLHRAKLVDDFHSHQGDSRANGRQAMGRATRRKPAQGPIPRLRQASSCRRPLIENFLCSAGTHRGMWSEPSRRCPRPGHGSATWPPRSTRVAESR